MDSVERKPVLHYKFQQAEASALTSIRVALLSESPRSIMNINIIRPVHLEFDLDNIGGLIDAGLSPDFIVQELTTALNPFMPAAVCLEVCSIEGREAYIEMRDGMTGVVMTEGISLGDWDGVCGDILRMLPELEEAGAKADVGLKRIPFAKRTHKRTGRAVLASLQTQAGAGTAYVGSTRGIAVYKLPYGALVGVEIANAYQWASALDDQVTAIRALRKSVDTCEHIQTVTGAVGTR